MVAQPTLSQKLASALPYHYKEGRFFREFRKELLRDYAGRTTYPGHGEVAQNDLSPEKQIVNLTLQACEASVMNLAASRPRFLCSSEQTQYEQAASSMERALNRYAAQLYLEEQLQEIARDSFFCVGVAKVYQAASAAVGAESDYRMDYGRPFVQRVSIDRFVWDTAATSPEEAAFMGDFYSMPWREAIRSSRFSQTVRNAIREMGHEEYAADSEKGEDLAKSTNAESVEDLIYLVDVFVRQPIKISGERYKSHIRTYVCDRQLNLKLEGKAVQVLGWDGDECGPYYILNMGPVPDHFMPSSPGQNLKLLTQLVNTLYRKIEDQSRRQKLVGTAQPGSGDAEIMANARDGEWVDLKSPESVNQIRTDGPDQNIFGAAIHFEEQHSQAAGNLKNKLGLAQGADTASQERMIGAMVSRFEAFYQQRYVSFVRKLAKGLSRLIYHDTKLKIPGKRSLPTNFNLEVDDDLLAMGQFHEDGEPARSGEYDDYAVDIDPESTPYRSSADRIAILDGELQLLMPMVPLLMQLGVQINLKEVFEERAKLRGMPIIARMLQFNQQPVIPAGGGQSEMPSSGGPNGQYTHTSQSTRSPESEAMQYFQAAQPQGSAA